MERNCISSLRSNGKALEKECCLPGVFCDSGDTPANLLYELNGHLYYYYYNTERMVRNKKTREVSACIALKVKEASLNLMHH